MDIYVDMASSLSLAAVDQSKASWEAKAPCWASSCVRDRVAASYKDYCYYTFHMTEQAVVVTEEEEVVELMVKKEA